MEKEQQYKKMLITVNGKPVGREIWIDKVTYAPVLTHEPTGKPSEPGVGAAIS
ncbi:hypothetical protein [Paenibacillus dendrobii]|uniref:hypothetical protein n=1 Tax=Paenibacillus dendrobii TaxID=2691084 RepID=UPI0019221D75|nr:hypothetical protein [Paenibacillus dendrobii]